MGTDINICFFEYVSLVSAYQVIHRIYTRNAYISLIKERVTGRLMRMNWCQVLGQSDSGGDENQPVGIAAQVAIVWG